MEKRCVVIDLDPKTSALLRYNPTIYDSFDVCSKVLQEHSHIMCSVSGGADSDIVVDILSKLDPSDVRVKYVWFNTGLEYQATQDHLSYLENRYGIEIERVRPEVNVPIAVRRYGQPFLSKYVSGMIERLQKIGFEFKDEPLEELVAKHPNSVSAMKWWCDAYGDGGGQYNIGYNRHLKEFMIQYPPWFDISARCCTFAKKDASHEWEKKNGIDLCITGVRRAEGGIRAAAYEECFLRKEGADLYMPLFYYKDADKEAYCKLFGIVHSDCYTKWGFTRTGCSCCPFGNSLQQELITLEIYEPKISVAAKNVFADSYRYTEMYKQFLLDNYPYERKDHPSARCIRCVETCVVYSTVSEAHEKTGANYNSISNCLRGLSKSAGGYHWEYADDKGFDYRVRGKER